MEDAKWIYDNCPVGTKVTIYDSKDPGPLGKPTPIRIDVNSPYRGWDPTDPDPRNPWLKLRPTIKGIKNKTIERTNSKVDLKKGVKATDYRGKTLKFTVSGKVNAAKTGKYKITYTAKDAKGNKTQKSIVITMLFWVLFPLASFAVYVILYFPVFAALTFPETVNLSVLPL